MVKYNFYERHYLEQKSLKIITVNKSFPSMRSIIYNNEFFQYSLVYSKIHEVDSVDGWVAIDSHPGDPNTIPLLAMFSITT